MDLQAQWRCRPSNPRVRSDVANLYDSRRNINPDGRRRIYVEQADLAGPYYPKPGPPESRKRIFVCEEPTATCARRIVENLGQRAYRRPMTQREVDQMAALVALAQRQGDSFDEGVQRTHKIMITSWKWRPRKVLVASGSQTQPTKIGPPRLQQSPFKVYLSPAAKRKPTRADRSTATADSFFFFRHLLFSEFGFCASVERCTSAFAQSQTAFLSPSESLAEVLCAAL